MPGCSQCKHCERRQLCKALFCRGQAVAPQWPGMCRAVSVLAAGLFHEIAGALGVGVGYDSLNVAKLRAELNKRDFPILGESFQPDYCLGCSTEQSLENYFCTVAQGFPQWRF